MSAIGIIIVIIIVVSIVLATRSKNTFHPGAGADGTSITRRVWLYLITLVSLGIFAAGVGQLLSLLFDATIRSSYLAQVGEATFNRQLLSLGLAMTVIGGPLWLFFWRAIQRRTRGNPAEIGSGVRKFFLNLVVLETAIMGLTAASGLFKWLISGAPRAESSSGGLAIVIVAAAVWAYHWQVSEREGHPSPTARTLRRWYVYVLSGFGLIWLALGLVQLIYAGVLSLPFWGDVLIRGQFWNDAAQLNVVQVILGGLAWYFHWFRMARGDFDSTLRQVYFYLLTISGGAIAALVASTIALFTLFGWAFRGHLGSVGPQLQFLGWAVPTILVGLAVWGYHQRLSQEEAGRVQEKRHSALRVHFYLMSFLGLGTLVAGLSVLFGILVDLTINAAGTSLIVTTGGWRNQLALCLALLLVGSPIWLYYWSGVLKRVRAGGIAESRAVSRRIFLYVIIGASILALTADLVNIIYQLLSGGLQGNLGVSTVSSSRWSLQTLVVAAPLLWYHWRILRADQRMGAEAPVIYRDVTLLANDSTGELVSRLQYKLGFKVKVLYPAGPAAGTPAVLSDEQIAKLAEEIQSSPSNKVLLVVSGGNVLSLPYNEK